MLLPRIIAVCGLKRAGKDTVARILNETFGYEHLQISKPLKDACKLLFGFSNEQLETDEKEYVDPRWNVSPRRVMQFIGTEVFQYAIHRDLPDICISPKEFWIRSVIDIIDHNPNKRYVISDLRFLHEEKLLKQRDVYIIKIIRTSYNESNMDNVDDHISEKEYHNILPDMIITNAGSIADLRNNIIKRFSVHLH